MVSTTKNVRGVGCSGFFFAHIVWGLVPKNDNLPTEYETYQPSPRPPPHLRSKPNDSHGGLPPSPPSLPRAPACGGAPEEGADAGVRERRETQQGGDGFLARESDEVGEDGVEPFSRGQILFKPRPFDIGRASEGGRGLYEGFFLLVDWWERPSPG